MEKFQLLHFQAEELIEIKYREAEPRGGTSPQILHYSRVLPQRTIFIYSNLIKKERCGDEKI